MSCGRTRSAPCYKSQTKLNVREHEWKNLMNECLLGTEILNKCDNENEKYLFENPNLTMDFRHKMATESTKIVCMPQLQTQTQALKLLRIKQFNRMLKQKEGKIVEKEIGKLKKNLENDRSLVEGKLNETTRKGGNSSTISPKFVKYYANQWKRLELGDGVVDAWLSRSVRKTMEIKMVQQRFPLDGARVSLKGRGEGEFLEPTPTLRGNAVTDEVECVKDISGISKDKIPIMQRFLTKNTELLSQELNDFKKGERIRGMLEVQTKINLRIISCYWMTWKVYTKHCKSRKTEKTNLKNKIETFLSNLQDRKTKETKKKMIDGNELKLRCRLEGTSNTREKQVRSEKKEKILKKLLEEVKISQAEARQKLREISKVRNREKSPNPEFLDKIQERRDERLKRWKEIQAKKLQRMEEKKNAEKLKEEEKRRKDEENIRKKLEESKEKMRLQKEKREEKEREREKLRVNLKLAEGHYRNHLLRNFGLRPWIQLMEIREAREQEAQAFHRRRLTRRAFTWLTWSIREEARLKATRALEFHERKLKKKFLVLWLDFHKETIERNQVAADWNEFKVTERAFQKWLRFTQDEQLEELNKKTMAVLNYERLLKRKYLNKLRDYPQIRKLEQAKENRKRKWRQRVKEILPDYQPAETCFV